MPYEVKLEVFEGPIDLLLHLISRQRVDIYEVSLATITDEYLRAVEAMDDLDLETATGFLVVAATLLELKSARLLPGRIGAEDDRLLEERDLLLARLIECSTYRSAGEWLAAALERGEARFGRTAGPEPHLVNLLPDPLAGVDLARLARAAARALAPHTVPLVDVSHIAPIRATVREAVAEVAATLRRDGKATFASLCGSGRPRIEVVVRFLALLELFKAGAIDLAQHDRFGDIVATWTGGADVDELLGDVEEYSLAVGS